MPNTLYTRSTLLHRRFSLLSLACRPRRGVLIALGVAIAFLSAAICRPVHAQTGADVDPSRLATTSVDVAPVELPDLVVDKSNDAAAPLYYGVTFTWTLTITNAGAAAATFPSTKVLLWDDLPVAATYDNPIISAATGLTGTVLCLVQNKVLTCHADGEVVLSPGGALAVTIAVHPTSTGVLANPASGDVCEVDRSSAVAESDETNNVCVQDTVTVLGVDLQLVKQTDLAQVAPGDSIPYTVTYRNGGNQAASGVVISETVPAGTTFDAAGSSSGWSCADGAAAGTPCTLAVGDLGAAQSGRARFGVRVVNPILDLLTAVINQAHIGDDGAHGVDVRPLDNHTAVSTPLLGVVEIAASQNDQLVSDNDDNGVVSPGDKIRYTLVVENLGTMAAGAVTVTGLLDSNAPLVVGTVNTDRGVIVTGNQVGQQSVKVDLQTLPPNQPATISFDVQIAATLPPGVAEISNQSTVSGTNFPTLSTDDPVTPAPADATITQIVASPKLAATMTDLLLLDSDGDQKPSPGDRIQYTVVIVNTGGRTATEIVFTELAGPNAALLPGSVVVDGGRGDVLTGNGAADSSVVVALDDLAGAGDQVELSYVVEIDNPLAAGVKTIVRQGAVSSSGSPQLFTDDPESAETGDATRTQVVAGAALVAIKRDRLVTDVDANTVPSPGDLLEYLVTIRNQGNAGAADLIFRDPLEENLLLLDASVQTSTGVVVSGNSAADRTVEIDLGDLAAGASISISFRVRIAPETPVSTTFVRNQAVVESSSDGNLFTDDPDVAGAANPTDTAIGTNVIIVATLRDYLLADRDDDGVVSAGDVLLYQLDVLNSGNMPAMGGSAEVSARPQVTLQTGTVQSSRGLVLLGNGPADESISVNIGVLPAGARATITFRMIVDGVAGLSAVEQQAVVRFADPRGGVLAVNSDDPDTALVGDVTLSALFRGPLSRLFLPVIIR